MNVSVIKMWSHCRCYCLKFKVNYVNITTAVWLWLNHVSWCFGQDVCFFWKYSSDFSKSECLVLMWQHQLMFGLHLFFFMAPRVRFFLLRCTALVILLSGWLLFLSKRADTSRRQRCANNAECRSQRNPPACPPFVNPDLTRRGGNYPECTGTPKKKTPLIAAGTKQLTFFWRTNKQRFLIFLHLDDQESFVTTLKCSFRFFFNRNMPFVIIKLHFLLLMHLIGLDHRKLLKVKPQYMNSISPLWLAAG